MVYWCESLKWRRPVHQKWWFNRRMWKQAKHPYKSSTSCRCWKVNRSYISAIIIVRGPVIDIEKLTTIMLGPKAWSIVAFFQDYIITIITKIIFICLFFATLYFLLWCQFLRKQEAWKVFCNPFLDFEKYKNNINKG